MTRPALRIVHDTNVVVSALLFDGKAGQLRQLWQTGAIVPVVCKETVAELLLTLRYPKFKLSAIIIEQLLQDYLPYASITVLPSNALPSDKAAHSNLPICRDPKDQVFLELSHTSNARFLVTGDADLLALRPLDTTVDKTVDRRVLNFTILSLTELFNQHFICHDHDSRNRTHRLFRRW